MRACKVQCMYAVSLVALGVSSPRDQRSATKSLFDTSQAFVSSPAFLLWTLGHLWVSLLNNQDPLDWSCTSSKTLHQTAKEHRHRSSDHAQIHICHIGEMGGANKIRSCEGQWDDVGNLGVRRRFRCAHQKLWNLHRANEKYCRLEKPVWRAL